MTSNISAGVVSDFISEVKNQCSSSNSLLVKKAMLELLGGDNSCEGTFSKKVLSKCNEINCEQLNEILTTIKSKYDGSVIGR